jgi:hypothetical protein
MASVVTVGTCSAKSPYCQNALRRQKHVSHKSNHTAVQKAENSATSQSVIGEKNLVQSHEGRITPNNRWFPMDARKAKIGPPAGFRRWRCPIARRRTEAGLPIKVRLVMAPRVKTRGRQQGAEPPVKMRLVKKIWRCSCKGQFATIVIPGAKSEEALVPSQGVIGEIKMASILRTTPGPTDQPARLGRSPARRLTPGTEEPVKVRSVGKKFSAGCMK